MVDVLSRVGAALKAEYGDKPIPSGRIREEVERIRGRNPGAGCPADFCYNLRKDGIRFPNDPMFLFLSRGNYQYVGLDFAYPGEVTHNPQGGVPSQVGHWDNGHYSPK